MLRILHVTPFYPPFKGGISNLVHNLCKELYKFDLDIHIITTRNIKSNEKYKERTLDKVTEIKSIYMLGWPYSTLKNFSFPADLGIKLNSIIKQGSFDVVHVHGHHYPICWLALGSAHKYKVPTVLSLHGTYALNPLKLGGKSWLEDLFNALVFKNILSKSNVVIGGTNQIIEHAKKYSKSRNVFKIIPNGVDINRFKNNLFRKKEYREKFGIPEDKIALLFVGRFDESKGALNFAKAAKLLLEQYANKFEIVMVGEGKLRSEIKSLVKGLNSINIYEWQPPEIIHEIYIASDVYVLPSNFEGLPLTILEAMAANLYIVYSNVGGVQEILQSYPRKMLLNNTTPEVISQTCISLYSESKYLNEDRFKNHSKFDWKNIAREINSVYLETQQLRNI